MSEIQEKPEIDTKNKIAITEAALRVEGRIMTVERDRQHQEARTGAEIGRIRPVLSSKNERRVSRKKISRSAKSCIWGMEELRIVLNVGVPINSNESARIRTGTNWRWQGFNFIELGTNFAWRNSPVEALLARIMLKNKLIVALTDSGSSVNLLSDTLYQEIGKPSQRKKNIIAAKNGKMPLEGSTAIHAQLQNITSEITVEFLVNTIEVTHCLFGLKFLK